MAPRRPSLWRAQTSSRIRFFHAKESIPLPLIHDHRHRSQISLADLCKEATPECTLNPFLFNGHLQTGWTVVNNDGPEIFYKRRVFHSEELGFPGSFAVDFATGLQQPSQLDGESDSIGLVEDPTGVGHHFLPPRTTYFSDDEFKTLGSNDRKPVLVVLHGLSGGSYESYLRHVIGPLVKKTPNAWDGLSAGAWDAIVINSRGCAGSRITSNFLYNARSTWDVRQIVRWLKTIWPNRPLFGAGFSLGANILTNVRGLIDLLVNKADRCTVHC